MEFLSKVRKFSQSAQKDCHGNTIGYCRLATILNDALYNYTKSQRASLAYYKLFQGAPTFLRDAFLGSFSYVKT